MRQYRFEVVGHDFVLSVPGKSMAHAAGFAAKVLFDMWGETNVKIKLIIGE